MTSPPHAPEPPDSLDAALHALHRDVLAEPVPSSLLDAGQRLSNLQAHVSQGRQWLSMAAGFVLAAGMGWFAHGLWQQGSPQQMSKGAVEREFVRQASFAYSVYQPEKRHPVEVTAAEHEHLVQWLSKRLGKPLKIPQLDAQGFELVGGRLLPSESGARAQFMFQDAQGRRLTLYLGSLEKSASNKADTESTQFRFDQGGAVSSFYWAEQGFGYALSGQVDKATLMALASTVYSQIN